MKSLKHFAALLCAAVSISISINVKLYDRNLNDSLFSSFNQT